MESAGLENDGRTKYSTAAEMTGQIKIFNQAINAIKN